ncbi:hypothetical protein ALC152_13980 [Arcobacter sp. 15-2]|uniref:MOSC domain-containing protein n=1 Tax=Arcobacter sp. 15-2 TaxID=3374109 RepID=UPI00399CD1A1
MKIVGKIQKLFISQKKTKTRVSKSNIFVDFQGIQEDKFYNKNIDRSILLSSIYAYELMNKQKINATHGELGENILVDFNPYDLEKGTQLLIGDVILEITIECTICNGLNKIDDKVPQLLKNSRGIFARVVQGGTIQINDTIQITN